MYPMRFRVVYIFLPSDIRRESKKKERENKRTNDYQVYMLSRVCV